MRAEDEPEIIRGIETDLAICMRSSKEFKPEIEKNEGGEKLTFRFKNQGEDGSFLKGVDRFLRIYKAWAVHVREWVRDTNGRPTQVGVEWTYKDGGPTTNIKHWVDLDGQDEFLRIWLATSGEPGYIRGGIYHRPAQKGAVLENCHQFVISRFHYKHKNPIGLGNHPLENAPLHIVPQNCGDGFNEDLDKTYQLTSLSEALVGKFDGELEIQTNDGAKKYQGKVDEVVVMPTGIYKPTVLDETFCHPKEIVDDPKRPWTTWIKRLGVRYSLSYSGQFVD